MSTSRRISSLNACCIASRKLDHRALENRAGLSLALPPIHRAGFGIRSNMTETLETAFAIAPADARAYPALMPPLVPTSRPPCPPANLPPAQPISAPPAAACEPELRPTHYLTR